MPMAPARSSGIDTKLALLNSPILDLKFNPTSCHRPDSPTSLEDSQSESGDSLDNIDSSATSESETTDTKSKARKLGDPSSSSLSLFQVATPPLSPAQPLFDQETQGTSNNLDIQDLHLNELSFNSMDVSRSPLASGTISSQPPSCTIPIVLEATAQGTSNAWKSLLPGVASTPSPMAPMAKSSKPRSTNNNYKSHDLRLNEILPIVLPPEREAKLSMEMIDLFEVRYTQFFIYIHIYSHIASSLAFPLNECLWPTWIWSTHFFIFQFLSCKPPTSSEERKKKNH